MVELLTCVDIAHKGVIGYLHNPHFTPTVPILQEAGRVPGPVSTGGKSRPHRDSISDLPGRSQSLFKRLILSESHKYFNIKFI